MHLAYNDKDLYGVDLISKEWIRKGAVVEVDKSTASSGFVSIKTPNWKMNNGSYVTMELHKLHGGEGFFGAKTKWVVRLLSSPHKNSKSLTVHGCVEGKNQLSALDSAAWDVQYNFISLNKLENY